MILLISYSWLEVAESCSGDQWCCYKSPTEGDYCKAHEYVPGGGKVILEPIDAPTATLEGDLFLQSYLMCIFYFKNNFY